MFRCIEGQPSLSHIDSVGEDWRHGVAIMEGKEGRKEERRKESVDSGMCSSSSSGQVSPVSSCGEVRRRDSVLKGVRQRMVSLV